MNMWAYILLAFVFSQDHTADSANHYVLKDNDFIEMRLDSPFDLREPHNLHILIAQITNNENAENAFRKMELKRSTLDEHISITGHMLENILELSKCLKTYTKVNAISDYLRMTNTFMKRLHFPEVLENEHKGNNLFCTDYANVNSSQDKYTHLNSFKPEITESLKVESERNILEENFGSEEAELLTAAIYEQSVRGLSNNPNSWKFHMLGSYYWRLVGNAKYAIECIRLSVMLAPGDSKDIPLLSLGNILVQAEQWDDAEVILGEAVIYGPNKGENYIALATVLALNHKFERARKNFLLAKELDVMTYPLDMHQYIDCLEQIDSGAAALFGFVKYMLKEIRVVGKLRHQVVHYQNKIIQLQTSLAQRFTANAPQLKADLLKRYQYCSTRKSSKNQEPVLFCDVYSDLQMQLESKQFDVELLDWKVNRYINHLFEKLPLEYAKQLEIIYNDVKAIIPT